MYYYYINIGEVSGFQSKIKLISKENQESWSTIISERGVMDFFIMSKGLFHPFGNWINAMTKINSLSEQKHLHVLYVRYGFALMGKPSAPIAFFDIWDQFSKGWKNRSEIIHNTDKNIQMYRKYVFKTLVFSVLPISGLTFIKMSGPHYIV